MRFAPGTSAAQMAAAEAAMKARSEARQQAMSGGMNPGSSLPPKPPSPPPPQNPRMEAVRQKLADGQRRANEISARLQQQRAELEARQAAMRAANNIPRPQTLPQRPMQPQTQPRPPVPPDLQTPLPRPGGTFQADLGRPDTKLPPTQGGGVPVPPDLKTPMPKPGGTFQTPSSTQTPAFKKGGKVAAKAPVKKAVGGPVKAKAVARPAAKMAKPLPAMKRGGKVMAKGRKK